MSDQKKNFRLEEFKHREGIDPDKTWTMLEHAIHEIYNQNISGLSYEVLYRNAYNMVLHKFGDKLYSGLVETMTARLKEIARSLEATQGGSFLEEMNKKWNDHNKALKMIREIMMYMDRIYIPHAGKTPVDQLGLNLWRENVIYSNQISTRLLNALLELVYGERTGEVINRGLFRNITKMLMDLGPSVYGQEFETQFLLVSAEFYQAESQKLIECCACGDFLKIAESRMKQEIDRVSYYLDPMTEKKITNVVEKVMIENNLLILIHMDSGLVSMLCNDKYEDLGRMYKLFRRVANGLFKIYEVMTSHIKESGKQLVMDRDRLKDPVEFGVSEDDIEITLDKVMMLFRYLQEKDEFESYYKRHLAKRLLYGKTVSDDVERSFIVKLRTECGYQFTSKLEGMFTDMKTSRDTMQGFYTSHPKLRDGPTLTVQVLTAEVWPTQSIVTCNLPAEMSELCEKFQSYYLGMHMGRKLSWQTDMGTADLKATFGKGQKHQLNVSTYQMCVLMLFNNADRLSYKEIEQATKIPSSNLKSCLQSLALVKKRNVLRKEPMSKDVGEDDAFFVNDKFRSKLYKVKIGTVVAQKESEPEKLETRKRVEEDRKPLIEATIVRIMKSRKLLDHNNLVAEVTKQLQSRFLPNPTAVKKHIESLIEREFLERDARDRKMYRYLY
uniref:Cullin-4A n=1 Tax=Cajanus cajan TaxID=3821 RepID=A0A151TFR8_CAJCA|nr:Cullin-4A [Cajanus cajan]